MRKSGVYHQVMVLFAAAALLCSGGFARASEAGRPAAGDPLVDLLVRKGILTAREAADLRREAEQSIRESTTPSDTESNPEPITASNPQVPRGLQGIQLGMLAYLDYSAGQSARPGGGEESYNRFTLTRGYLTLKKSITPWLGARITTDIHQDANEDWKVRLKYLYAEVAPGSLGPFTDMKMEIGQGHIPWLDFEEHVNPYRCQGTMAIERAGIFNSADIGLSLRGGLSGRLADAGELTGNHHYDGRFGSWHLGVYNGPGYHAAEKNGNKVFEGRVTVRPLPELLPGLQFSYFGVFGEGNTEWAGSGDYPDYDVNLGMISYEHPWAIMTAQYFTTEGNAKGSLVDGDGDALDTGGYSLFGRIMLPVPGRKLGVFGRYDYFDPDRGAAVSGDSGYEMLIGGLSYDFYKGNLLLFSWESTDYEAGSGGKGKGPVPGNRLGDEQKVQVVWQIKF